MLFPLSCGNNNTPPEWVFWEVSWCPSISTLKFLYVSLKSFSSQLHCLSQTTMLSNLVHFEFTFSFRSQFDCLTVSTTVSKWKPLTVSWVFTDLLLNSPKRSPRHGEKIYFLNDGMICSLDCKLCCSHEKLTPEMPAPYSTYRNDSKSCWYLPLSCVLNGKVVVTALALGKHWISYPTALTQFQNVTQKI